MRKATIIIFLGIAVAAVASVSSVKWKSTMLDLGEVKVGKVSELKFEFTNLSDVPFTILDAKGSCGCTKIAYPKTAILPGETAFVTAHFRAAGPGMFNKTIRIQTSESNSYTYLKFKGEAVN